MTGQQAADQFVAKYTGQYIDEDKYYGSQCWDVVARYAREMWGCPSFPTGSGGAEGLYRLYQQPIPQFFDKVSRDQLQPGDIVVWGSSFYPPYGHTALVWRREGNTLFVLEQDGSKDPNGDGNADGVSYIAQRAIISSISGGLRPKGVTNNTMTEQEAYAVVAEIFRGVTDVDPEPQNADNWAKKIAKSPASAAELAKTLYGEYKGDPNFRYYGRHYSEDMNKAKKDSYEAGLAAGGGSSEMEEVGTNTGLFQKKKV